MISEKTVELNLTTELVNWNFHLSGVRPYILAPSQRQEGTLGFDASISYPGKLPTLIQYKRAYFKSRKNELEFHLNRNKLKDQHLRLFVLELLGHDVWYALPLFYKPTEVISHRRRLLTFTLFIKPSWIIPIGGLTGHHEVKYNITTKKITVHSEEGKEIERHFDFWDFAREFESKVNSPNIKNETIDKFIKDFNRVFAGTEPLTVEGITLQPANNEDNELSNSMNLLII